MSKLVMLVVLNMSISNPLTTMGEKDKRPADFSLASYSLYSVYVQW